MDCIFCTTSNTVLVAVIGFGFFWRGGIHCYYEWLGKFAGLVKWAERHWHVFIWWAEAFPDSNRATVVLVNVEAQAPSARFFCHLFFPILTKRRSKSIHEQIIVWVLFGKPRLCRSHDAGDAGWIVSSDQEVKLHSTLQLSGSKSTIQQRLKAQSLPMNRKMSENTCT